MNKFNFTPLTIPGVILIEPKVFEDSRGYFIETYNKKDFEEAGIKENFVQDNFSFSKKGVIRGMHFSKAPHETVKLVSCISGEILDVAVDVRPNSPTFGKWVSEILSGDNHKMLFIPKGFAHGFCALSDTVKIVYKVNDYYFPESEQGIIYNDRDLAINWPISEPILSDKDKLLPVFKDLFK
ncbi:MAG: dTDP-4-dehydrorhamnose 3,5-epimerase [Candidatus Paceibacterota bacterium]|jgi:dTDP-4-dehydrorhamnose 3,5-epimerase